MEHRKRNRWQHKMEMSTSMKMVVAGRKKQSIDPFANDETLISRLVSEAICSWSICDSCTRLSDLAKTIPAGGRVSV